MHYMAAIGFSAGGLNPVIDFFEHTPNDNVSYVILQHLPDGFQTRLNTLLNKHSRLPARIAEAGMEARTDTVYVQPAHGYLSLAGNCFTIEERTTVRHFPNRAIDIFFTALARSYGDRSIGIILSGGGMDGTAGILAIKKAGGLVLSQDIQSSSYSGMPFNAINTGRVDDSARPAALPDIIRSHIEARQNKV